mgnify:CR=1 FL=1
MKKLITALLAAGLIAGTQVTYADSTEDVVSALVGKGVLTEEEGALILKGHKTQKATTRSEEHTSELQSH